MDSIGKCSFDCTAQSVPLKPNPDIDGIGILIGFVGTAYTMIVFLIGYYLFGLNPDLDPFRDENDWSSKARKCNPVDKFILRPLRQRMYRHRESNAKWHHRERFFNNVTRSLSDIQLLTGAAILISAFATLRCGLSTFHWQIVVYTAWFSSMTHMAALTLLRKYLYNHQSERTWRLFATGVFIALLIAALVPMGNSNFYASHGNPAICYVRNSPDTASLVFVSMMVNVLILMFIYVSRLIKLHKTLVDWLDARLRRRLSQWCRKLLFKLYVWANKSESTLPKSLVYFPFVALYLMIRLVIDLYASVLGEIYWLVISAAWASIHLFTIRLSEADTIRNTWTFGQILPIVLLLGPLITVMQCLYSDNFKKANNPVESHPIILSAPPQITNSVVEVSVDPVEEIDSIPELCRNNYGNVKWFTFYVWAAIFWIAFFSAEVLWISNGDVIYYFLFVFLWPIVNVPLFLWFLALVFLRLDQWLEHKSYGQWIYLLIWICVSFEALQFCIFPDFGPLLRLEVIPELLLPAMLGTYILGCFIHELCIVMGRLKQHSNLLP